MAYPIPQGGHNMLLVVALIQPQHENRFWKVIDSDVGLNGVKTTRLNKLHRRLANDDIRR